MPGLETITELRHFARRRLGRQVERLYDWLWFLRRRALPMVLLQDQRPLSESELQSANSIIDWVEEVMAARPDYLKRHRLSRAIHFPQAIWALDKGEGLYDGFRAVLSRDPRVLNHLRLWTQHFTGYRLLSMEVAEGRPFPRPEEIGPSVDKKLSTLATKPDRWVGRYLRIAGKLPPEYRLAVPRQLGEIGWNVDGRTVSFDTYAYLERLAVLHDCGLIDRLKRIAAAGRTPYLVEIGGGFGGLAYHLSKLIPQARIVIVDLPESLLFSSLYLSLLLPQRAYVYASPANDEPLVPDTPGCTFLPNYLFDRLLTTGTKCDLAINTLSMSEMEAAQVDYYCDGLTQLLADDGVFFEQNHNNKTVGRLNAKEVIARHFGHRRELHSRAARSLTQGRIHLWARPADSSRAKRPVPQPLNSPPLETVPKYGKNAARNSRAARVPAGSP
jgi:hypothetical protein